MANDPADIRHLVDGISKTYEQVAALFYDAKMRTTGAGFSFRYAPAPPGSTSKKTLALVEPIIRGRNPEWLKGSRGPMKVPAELRNARRKDSAMKHFLADDPADVVVRFERQREETSRAVARALGRDDLASALEVDGPGREAAMAALLNNDTVREAIGRVETRADEAARSAAQERVATDRASLPQEQLNSQRGPNIDGPDFAR